MSKVSLIIIGDGRVGKTSLACVYSGKGFNQLQLETKGVDFVQTEATPTRLKNKVDSHTCKVTIWDTAGQERFRSLAKGFY